MVVIGMLVALVAVTIADGFALNADGARHAGIGAAVFVAAIIGFGGPVILRLLRRWVDARASQCGPHPGLSVGVIGARVRCGTPSRAGDYVVSSRPVWPSTRVP